MKKGEFGQRRRKTLRLQLLVVVRKMGRGERERGKKGVGGGKDFIDNEKTPPKKKIVELMAKH